ncbi:MAG: cytochrome b N-terminal domain-containing protein [Ignavibacteriales bacterium]|nr:cytochrome b N-terminal domain-containing protein [Ignavibacteriales bacterium]
METAIEEIKVKSLKDRVIDLIQEDVPDYLNKFVYCMGATPLVLFLVALATGILMTFYYIPYPDKAYASVEAITHDIYLGWFIRGLHKLSVNLMIFTLFLHALRVFITRAYSAGELKWLIGALLLFTTLGMGFTGYALVYDQVSYWGMTVVMNMIEEMPVAGPAMAYLLRGGAEVSEITLLRLYDLHTKLLPVLLILCIAAHIAAIRIIDFAKMKDEKGVHLFYPEHALKVGLVAVGIFVVMVNLVMIFPPAIGQMANPLEVASNVAPPWYFSAVYKWITIAPRQSALFALLLFSALFVLYPYIDRFLVQRGFRMERINIVLGTAAVSAFAALTLWNVLF